MSEFTKGPWVFEEWNQGKCFEAVYGLLSSKGESIGVHIEDKANAHLIAAAPDMYEALEECAKHHQGQRSLIGATINNALAKAKGESE